MKKTGWKEFRCWHWEGCEIVEIRDDPDSPPGYQFRVPGITPIVVGKCGSLEDAKRRAARQMRHLLKMEREGDPCLLEMLDGASLVKHTSQAPRPKHQAP